MPFIFIIVLIISFLLGSLPTAVLVGKILGVDVRRQGSCNPGATNLTRLSGKRGWGALVLSVDALKGFLPARFGAEVVAALGPLPQGLDEWSVRVILGSTAILGHVLSIFLAFHGGKGVATSLGVALAFYPLVSLICFVLWGILAELTRRISISSLLAGLTFPVILAFKSDVHTEVLYFACILPFFLAFMHRNNLINLLRCTEPSIAREKLVRHLFSAKNNKNQDER